MRSRLYLHTNASGVNAEPEVGKGEKRRPTFQPALGRVVRELTPWKKVGCEDFSREISLSVFSHKSVFCSFCRPGDMGLLCLQRLISRISLRQGVRQTLTKANDEL
jgi:hypothetical protein